MTRWLYRMSEAARWLFFFSAALGTCFLSNRLPADEPKGERVFFGFSKSMVRNPVPMQERGSNAVHGIVAELSRRNFKVHTLVEPVRDFNSYRSKVEPFLVTRERILAELDWLARNLKETDTVVIYSHSHGIMSRGGKPGGLALDDRGMAPRRLPEPLNWAEYAEALLRLPARNVIVLTMACFSGGLAEQFNRPSVKAHLEERRKQGRNFLLITSQNSVASSNPRRISGRIMNPFTWAVTQAFSGKADGYSRETGRGLADGTVTLQELADYVVDEAKKHRRASDSDNDPDPQLAGSYDPDEPLLKI